MKAHVPRAARHPLVPEHRRGVGRQRAGCVEGELVDVPLEVVRVLEELLAGSVGASPGGGGAAEAVPRITFCFVMMKLTVTNHVC